MDVNGTRYHLLLGESDHQPLLDPVAGADQVAWSAELGAVTLAERVLQLPAGTGQDARPELRRGAAVDRFGHWYWLAEDDAGNSVILQKSADQRAPQRFWPREAPSCHDEGAGAFGPVDAPVVPRELVLRGLTVTREHYLMVGSLSPAGLWIFDLHAGGPPLLLEWPQSVPFAPFDLAARPDGGAWILDRHEDGTQRCWAVDGRFAVIPVDQPLVAVQATTTDGFQAADGGAPRVRLGYDYPTGISLALASPVEVPGALAVEALADGSVLVLASGAGVSTVSRHRYGAMIGTPVALAPLVDAVITSPPRPFSAQDFALVPAATGAARGALGTLFVAAADGDQCFAFDLRDDPVTPLVVRLEHYPMRLFGMKALVLDTTIGRVAYDAADRWVTLGALPRPRFAPGGALAPWVIDGREPGCVWHRLFLDACIPPGSRVSVETRAADLLDQLPLRAWQREPAPYLRPRGTELEMIAPQPSARGNGTWELLFQQARGRYLAIRVTLEGNGRSSPSIHAMRAYYPRFSYLREYLPDVYQRDPGSASFLDRFLANVEGVWTEMEGRIAAAQNLFDVRTVPADYLDWLGRWVGAIFEPTWTEAQRRMFLAHAPLIFQRRGTTRGLEDLLHLAIDPCVPPDLFTQTGDRPRGPRVLERFTVRGRPRLDARAELGSAPAGRWTPAAGGGELHRLFRAHLEATYGDVAAIDAALGTTFGTRARIRFSAVPPSNAALLAQWRSFIAATFDFDYVELGVEEAYLYRDHLRRRYGSFAEYARVYGLTGELPADEFAAVSLPLEGELPADGPPLVDWFELLSTVVPIVRAAHRFVVLVPAAPDDSDQVLTERLARARQVIERERPGHTDFEVQPFWDLFRVGDVRVGIDAEIGPGSRYVAVVLGATRVADGYLAAAHPFDETDRMVVDRDGPGAAAPLS